MGGNGKKEKRETLLMFELAPLFLYIDIFLTFFPNAQSKECGMVGLGPKCLCGPQKVELIQSTGSHVEAQKNTHTTGQTISILI